MAALFLCFVITLAELFFNLLRLCLGDLLLFFLSLEDFSLGLLDASLVVGFLLGGLQRLLKLLRFLLVLSRTFDDLSDDSIEVV